MIRSFTGLVFILLNYIAVAQHIPEPEVVGYVYWHDSVKVHRLERQLIEKNHKHYYFPGAKSTKQIKQTDTITFIVRVLDHTQHPNVIIRFFEITSNEVKDMRILPTRKDNAGNYRIRLIDYDTIEMIDFIATPYGKSSFKVQVANLPIGSYTIKVINDRFEWNLFDVVE
jgi:hypothetical protein